WQPKWRRIRVSIWLVTGRLPPPSAPIAQAARPRGNSHLIWGWPRLAREQLRRITYIAAERDVMSHRAALFCRFVCRINQRVAENGRLPRSALHTHNKDCRHPTAREDIFPCPDRHAEWWR